MKTFVVLGTCASEDWYHHQDPRRRLPLKLGATCQQSAIASLDKPPVPVPGDLGRELLPLEASKLRMDLERSFLESLTVMRPDILIVDLLLDALRGIIHYGGGWITNSYLLRKSALAEICTTNKVLNPFAEQAAYMEVFSVSLAFLADFLKTRLPECRVILHRARCAEYFIDKEGYLRPFEPASQISFFVANLRIRSMEAAFQKAIACDVLTVDEVPFLADSQHIWGHSTLHYHKDYYRHFTRKLEPLVGA